MSTIGRWVNGCGIVVKLILVVGSVLGSVTASLSQDLSPALDSMMTGMVKSQKLHGCVTYVRQGDSVLHFKSYGFKDIERNRIMGNDVIFRIASMTKVLVAAGALRLYEEGRFLLDDPVWKYLPQFKNVKAMKDLGTDSAKVVDPERDITIRDLFRHTAGFGYTYLVEPDNDTIDKLYLACDLATSDQTSEEFINKLSGIPLKYSPGSKWLYSYATDVLGIVVEKISGKTLHDYLTESIFLPLDMKSTGFYVSRENAEKLSANYRYENGKLVLVDDPATSSYLKPPTVYSGGGGLKDDVGGIVTTAGDFANFCSMLLNYGKYNGKQILSPQTVELMISDQIGAIWDRGFKVSGYGLGIGVEPEKNGGRTISVYWAGGPFNTTFAIDYEKQVIAIMLTQNSPWGHQSIQTNFKNLIMTHLPR